MFRVPILIWRANRLITSQSEQQQCKKLAAIGFVYGESLQCRFERFQWIKRFTRHNDIGGFGAKWLGGRYGLHALAVAFPNLEKLCLTPSPDTRGPIDQTSSATLNSLMSFAKHCPRLRHLGLFFDASMRISVPSSFSSRCDLRSLDVGVSNISSVEGVCVALLRLFPNLETFLYDDNWRDDATEWESFEEMEERCSQWAKVRQGLATWKDQLKGKSYVWTSS